MRLRLLGITLLAVFAPGTAAALASDPPMCLPATVTTAPGVPVNLQINCVDAGLNPTVTIVTPPIGGTLAALPGQYVPSAGFHGVDHLVYTVTNTVTGQTSEQTAINLVVNSRPACADGTATTTVGTPLKLVFPCPDPDGDPVLVRAEDGQHGVVDPDVGSQFTYTPEPGYVGTDEISFVGIDGAFTTGEHTLTITVTPPPTATATPSPTPPATPTAVPSTTPPPPAPAADKTAPAVTVKAARGSITKGITFTLNTNEAGTATLTLTAGKNTVTKTVTVAKGTIRATLQLSAKAR
jgi:hypothetical protein